MSIVLLPEKSGAQTCHWPSAGDQGIVKLHPQVVGQNLIQPSQLAAQGVSHPWSAALSFQWRLETSDLLALDLLWSVLLAQHVGLVSTRRMLLTPGTPLQDVLLSAGQLGPGSSLVLLEWKDPASDLPAVLAGSLPQRWLLFPSTAYQSPEGLGRITDLLLARATGLQRSGSRATLSDASQDGVFRRLLTGLAERDERDGPWCSALKVLARGEPPAHVPALDGLVPQRVKGEEWECPAHEVEGHRWAADPAVACTQLSPVQSELTCSVHNQGLTGGGRPVVIEDLGVTTTDSGLIVWTDADLNPNLHVERETSGAFVITYAHGPRFRVNARGLTLRDILCPSPAKLPAVTAEPTSALPIRSEYLQLVAGETWDAARQRWRVTLRGRQREELLDVEPAGDAGTDSGFALWPRSSLEDWGIDVVGAYHQFQDQAAVVEQDASGRLVVSPWRKMPLVAVTRTGTARYLALKRGAEERGAVVFQRSPEVIPHAPTGLIALDFGTSNSLLSYGTVGTRQEEFVEHGVRSVEDSCRTVGRGSGFPGSLIGALDVFSAWYEVSAPGPLLGTLLLRKRDLGTNELQWSVLPRDPALIRNVVEEPNTTLLANLKWDDLGHPDGEALATYLERILLPAMAALRRRGVTELQVAVSFPLAFEPSRLLRLSQALDDTLRRLCPKVGLNARPVRKYSESHAGIRAIPSTFSDYAITLDMGGGTTDLAIMRGDHVLAADSLRIGARKVLAAVAANRSGLRERLLRAVGAASAARVGVTDETLIETLIQARGVDAVVAELPPDNRLLRRQAIAALFAAIALATHRLLTFVLPTGNGPATANVFLLGQGWGLLSPHLTQGVSEESFARLLRSLGGPGCRLDVQSAGVTSLERKLKVADGTMKLLRAGSPDTNALPMSYVGMDLRLRDGSTLPATTPLDMVQQLEFASDDPGFGDVVNELVGLMMRLPEPARPLGDPSGWLLEPDPRNTGGDRVGMLIREGCQELKDMTTSGGGLRWSPLVRFLSGPWADYWIRALES